MKDKFDLARIYLAPLILYTLSLVSFFLVLLRTNELLAKAAENKFHFVLCLRVSKGPQSKMASLKPDASLRRESTRGQARKGAERKQIEYT